MKCRIISVAILAAGAMTLPGAVSPALAAANTGVGERTGVAMALIVPAAVILFGLLFRHRAHGMAEALRRWRGRRRVRRIVAHAGLELLEDFILPGACDGLARIDHAVLTSGGIVCLRTKHCNGMIFGDAGEPQWHIVDGVKRRRFLNPVIQNDGRVRAMRRVVADMPIASLVVITGFARFATPPPADVIHVSNLENWLASYQEKAPAARDPEAAWLSLRAAARTDAASHKDFEAQLSFG